MSSKFNKQVDKTLAVFNKAVARLDKLEQEAVEEIASLEQERVKIEDAIMVTSEDLGRVSKVRDKIKELLV